MWLVMAPVLMTRKPPLTKTINPETLQDQKDGPDGRAAGEQPTHRVPRLRREQHRRAAAHFSRRDLRQAETHRRQGLEQRRDVEEARRNIEGGRNVAPLTQVLDPGAATRKITGEATISETHDGDVVAYSGPLTITGTVTGELIVVDGGTAQKNAAEVVLKKYGVAIPIVAVVKDEYHRPKRLMGSKTHIARFEDAILLANAEAHRFSIAYHRQKRGKLG